MSAPESSTPVKVTAWWFRRVKPVVRPPQDVAADAPEWIIVLDGKIGSDHPSVPVGKTADYTSKRLLRVHPAALTVTTESRALHLVGPADPDHLETLELLGSEVARRLQTAVDAAEADLPPISGNDYPVPCKLATEAEQPAGELPLPGDPVVGQKPGGAGAVTGEPDDESVPIGDPIDPDENATPEDGLRRPEPTEESPPAAGGEPAPEQT
jgi:hypothetical protein